MRRFHERFRHAPQRRDYFAFLKGTDGLLHIRGPERLKVALESLDPDHKYTLLLSASEKTAEGGVEHHRKAELIETDPHVAVSQHLLLYESEFLETID